MQIDESDEQREKAARSREESLEPGSNVAANRDLHPSKQFWPMSSTVSGMQIDDSDEHPQNAEMSMHESLEPDSKVTVDRERH
jgi:hypothetical protein